jgi:hypothetical protein
MPAVARKTERRQGARSGLLVRHRHRTGSAVSERISELVYVDGRPVALLDWINLGGIRTPLYICDLDPKKLRPDRSGQRVFHYDDITTDPRFPGSA